MIRFSLLFALAAAGLTAAAAAESVPVRSGEHGSFSRLVYADDPGRTWSVETGMGSSVEIRFSTRAPVLDLARIFDFIPKERIAGVEQRGNVLILTLACTCLVDVFQIPTGHIVIDVRDAPPLSPSLSTVPGNSAPVLPIIFPVLPIAIDLPLSAPQPAARTAPEPTVNPTIDINGPPQVRRHESGSVPLVRTASLSEIENRSIQHCQLEAMASRALLADPREALARIENGTTIILDGEDQLDSSGLMNLSADFLAAGWGSEALRVLRLNGIVDHWTATIAAALDGEIFPEGEAIDPACGPASAIVALLNPAGMDSWNRTDPSDLAQFVDRLHPATLANILGRLKERLAKLDASEVLVGIKEDGQHDAPPRRSVDAIAAGTDIGAVIAATSLLADAMAAGLPTSQTHLLNALALLPSLSPSDERTALAMTLGEAMALSNHPSMVASLVADGVTNAEDILSFALDRMSPANMAELAVRLRPFLNDGSDASRSAAASFRQFGLNETALAFDRNFATAGLVPVPIEPDQHELWLSRDMAALAAVDRSAWTDRNAVAAAIVARNSDGPPSTDLAAAETVLEDSRSMSAAIARLLLPKGSDGRSF